MRPTGHRRRGSALVITVGLLAVLAVIGFGFAVLARLHHDISTNYRASAQNDLIAHAAIHYGIREVRYGWSNAHTSEGAADPEPTHDSFQVGGTAEPTDGPQAPWFIDPSVAAGGYKDDAGKLRYCNLRCNSYALVHDDLGDRVAISMIKVLDSAGKLNINDKGVSQLQNILTRLFSTLNITGANAATIASTRFTSLQELKQLMEASQRERNFEILKHYLTIYSWPHGLPSVQGFTPYIVRPTGSSTLSRVDGTLNPPNNIRSPINMNTAGKELLAALLEGVRTTGAVELTQGDAQHIARWIARKREPENRDHWDGQPINWGSWAGPSSQYGNCLQRLKPCWRSYALGPFDSWHEAIDFLYAVGPDRTGIGDPFPQGLSSSETVEAAIAAICPNSFSTSVGHNTWNLDYVRLDSAAAGEQVLRDRDTSGTTTQPQIYGKNNLAADGDTHPFCFSSLGRFEIYSRTYTFIKADQGKATAVTPYTLRDDQKRWPSSPPRWRGYSVLIYEGKGKGQLRGIVQLDDPNNDGISDTLIVDRWGVLPDTTSRYLILGPGPLIERVGTTGSISVLPATPYKLSDDRATWENGEWNGHRIVIYRAASTTGPSGEPWEKINDQATIQERTIVDTVRDSGGSGHYLIVSPPLDSTLLTQDTHFGYLILGCDGTVEHEAAIKAYDAIRHTTQKDFRDCLDGTSVRIATGPNACEVSDASSTDRSPIDGWIGVKNEDVATNAVLPGATVSGEMVQNFNKRSLAPDTGGTLKANSPSSMAGDTLADSEACLTSDGLRLRSGSAHYANYDLTSPLITKARHEGGLVSFWYRPDEGFFTSTRTLARVIGSSASPQEDIVLRSVLNNNVPTLTLIVRAMKQEQYADDNENPILINNVVVAYKQDTHTYTDATLSDLSSWKAGEWHHIAFAWYECANDDVTTPPAQYDDDSNANTDWRDDDATAGVLDNHVMGRVAIWVDGTRAFGDVPAFNLKASTDSSGPNAGHLQLGSSSSDGAGGTLDGVIAYRIGGDAQNDRELNITVGVTYNSVPRYAGVDLANPGNTTDATYVSTPITLVNTDSQELTLGSVAWTSHMPWCKSGERWGGPSYDKYPIEVEVILGGLPSTRVPRHGLANEPALGGGLALRTGSSTDPNRNTLIRSTSNTIQYKVYLSPFHGEVGQTDPKGKLKGRQTPILDDITITYLGPVVFFHWH